MWWNVYMVRVLIWSSLSNQLFWDRLYRTSFLFHRRHTTFRDDKKANLCKKSKNVLFFQFNRHILSISLCILPWKDIMKSLCLWEPKIEQGTNTHTQNYNRKYIAVSAIYLSAFFFFFFFPGGVRWYVFLGKGMCKQKGKKQQSLGGDLKECLSFKETHSPNIMCWPSAKRDTYCWASYIFYYSKLLIVLSPFFMSPWLRPLSK